MMRFKGFLAFAWLFAVAILPSLSANEWLLSRDNANRTKILGPYNVPKIATPKAKQYIAPNRAKNPSANPNCPQRQPRPCGQYKCTYYSQNAVQTRQVRQTPQMRFASQTRQTRFTPQQRAVPQAQIRHISQSQMQMQPQIQPQNPQIQPQIQPNSQITQKPESNSQITPKAKSAPKPKIDLNAQSQVSPTDSSVDSRVKCDSAENPCGDYECIYQIGACRKSEPKTYSKPQPKAWIDEMQLEDLPQGLK